MDQRTLTNWLSGGIPLDIRPILRLLFGDHPAYVAWRGEMTLAYARERERKRSRKPRPSVQPPPPPADSNTPAALPDEISAAPVLGFKELDELPLDTNWKFQNVRYGIGPQRVVADGELLVYLPESTRLLREDGTARHVAEFVPHSREERERLAQSKHLFFPRDFRVTGGKRDPNWEICVHICTDIPYGSAIDARIGGQFEIECGLCLGGMAAFIDHKGELRRESFSEPEGSGCAAVMVAIAYRGGVPQCKSRYALLVRKGIFYPDDVLFSRDGKPFASKPHNIPESRFFFQSKETKGLSTDIYVCDYNGTNLCNINADDGSAWDGFYDGDDKEIAGWTEDGRIRFCSSVRGRGIAEVITRPDCIASSAATTNRRKR